MEGTASDRNAVGAVIVVDAETNTAAGKLTSA